MWTEKPNFEKMFTRQDAERVGQVIKQQAHVVSVGLYGDILSSKTAPALNFVIVVDDNLKFTNYINNLEQIADGREVGAKVRVQAASYILGDECMAEIDSCFPENECAGNFIDLIILPPDWQERIDQVQSLFPFKDVTVGNLIKAEGL